MELRHLKGDLGRTGGLLKLALSEGADRFQINRLLRELDLRQHEMGGYCSGGVTVWLNSKWTKLVKRASNFSIQRGTQ